MADGGLLHVHLVARHAGAGGLARRACAWGRECAQLRASVRRKADLSQQQRGCTDGTDPPEPDSLYSEGRRHTVGEDTELS
jgi:hypothetical protein